MVRLHMGFGESVRILKNQPKVVGTRCRKLVL